MSWFEPFARSRPFRGPGRFPIRAYSEFLPPPWVGVKPTGDVDPSCRLGADDRWSVSEYEEHEELRPGLGRVGRHVMLELGKLVRGERHAFSRTLLEENPAWSKLLLGKTRELTLVLPLALSRTQDDKGNRRWTLFGTSHEGPARPYWRSFPHEHAWLLHLAFLGVGPEVRVLPHDSEEEWGDEGLPDFVRPRLLRDGDEPPATVFTFRPFDRLPGPLKEAYLEGRTRIVPTPASLVFFWHHAYRKLEQSLARGRQISLLHLFPRTTNQLDFRIPQTGWFDEHNQAEHLAHHGPAGVKPLVTRVHRWQRIERDEAVELDDKVSIALFSTQPDDLGLYNKPMARNAQIWSEQYELILDGPSATKKEICAAERALRPGGHFGYRFYYPPMRVLEHEVFWHRPLVARFVDGQVQVQLDGPSGYLTAENGPERRAVSPEVLARTSHLDAAQVFPRDPGQKRRTTSHNVRKILEWSEYLGGPIPPSLARALVRVKKQETLEGWLASLPERASDRERGARVASALRSLMGAEADLGAALTFEETRQRAFEERYWKRIASLAEGEWRAKGNADGIACNAGRTGGEKAKLVPDACTRHHRDLDSLGEHLHRHYEALAQAAGVEGALSADHVFAWETDFDFEWSRGWVRNQLEPSERNIVFIIPGKNRGEAVVMGDHYDTAYMEDLYEPMRGGDRLRAAAAGADDNHSATAALMHAAEVLLPLAKAGKLERDVWLVHLTGEEFPADCLGARNLCQALIEESLVLRRRDGSPLDVSGTRVKAAFVLDMIAHNNDHARDIFQIAPGEGRASARLSWHAHLANELWNRKAAEWNASPERKGKGRARRVESGAETPPLAEHLPLAGEIRPEWSPRSALYNTDGQIFSDVGIPVVLFMENYDIRRDGYHDTHDTMKNIDLDYGAALAAIAIETVARVACAREI